MKETLIAVLILASTLATAKKKHDDSEYHDGIFVAYHKAEGAGFSCRQGDCDSYSTHQYEIVVDGTNFILEPAVAHPKTGVLTLGWSAALQKSSVLHGQLPKTPIKVRVDGAKVYVRVGDRESPYKVVSAQ